MLYGQCEYQVTNKINMKEHIHNNDEGYSCDQYLYHAELNYELQLINDKQNRLYLNENVVDVKLSFQMAQLSKSHHNTNKIGCFNDPAWKVCGWWGWLGECG